MSEEKKPIVGFENFYEISRSGRIFSVRRKRTMKRCGDEYGFHIVKLSRDGTATNYNLFDLWKIHFPEAHENEFKGARKVIYK